MPAALATPSSTESIASARTLDELWTLAETIATSLEPKNGLPAVMGGGRCEQPALACVFINPTHRNQSTQREWRGTRAPFIGTKPVWRFLAAAGLFPRSLCDEIDRRAVWGEEFAEDVYAAVAAEGLYITNAVKRTGANAVLPTPAMVSAFRELLVHELQLVRPRAIVTFGAIPFKALTGESIKLSEELDAARVAGHVSARNLTGLEVRVYPCYFPVGHGNAKAAIEMLGYIRRQCE